MEPIIEFHNVCKEFRLGEQFDSYATLRDLFSGKRKANKLNSTVKALNKISFSIEPGDCVGIIGRNGSGKSTLLKILSQITFPSSGKIILRGRVGSLLEVGTGFHGELTGKENIFFNGALLGLKKSEITAKYDEIVSFSGVGKFIDTPLKHYSSGMQLRLAFSVAAHLEPEILAVDEVLAVGDAEFQKKSLGKMSDVAKSGRTILFVSHNMGVIASLCNKVAILNYGELIDYGETKPMIEKYLAILETNTECVFQSKTNPELPAQLIYASLVDSHGSIQNEFAFSEPISIKFKVAIHNVVKNSMMAVILYDQLKERVFTVLKPLEILVLGEHGMTLSLPQKLIAPGFYTIGIEVFAHLDGVYQNIDHIISFSILDDGTVFSRNSYGNYGRVIIDGEWFDE
ncbi:MAG: ABC transporter ATP-binding protein [Bacteroidetes bacterium HGW-Bacteroidetes-6]|jgi:lipopolysaccharide transport system ATP-binding protein|nr:MAG: ABC transporter ATP-binding protein [Bacteroidetes bacterium HGW-Bacteroidetes-6]